LSKQHNKDEQSKNNETLRALANFSQIGITMAATIAGAAIKSLFDMTAGKQ